MDIVHAEPGNFEDIGKLAAEYTMQINKNKIKPVYYKEIPLCSIVENNYGFVMAKDEDFFKGILIYSSIVPKNHSQILKFVDNSLDNKLEGDKTSFENPFFIGKNLVYVAHLEAFPKKNGTGKAMLDYLFEMENIGGIFGRCEPSMISYFEKIGLKDTGIRYKGKKEKEPIPLWKAPLLS